MAETAFGARSFGHSSHSQDDVFRSSSSEMERKAEIVGSETRESPQKPFTVYTIQVTHGSSAWTIHRRYNQFFNLFNKLREQFPSIDFHFPPKKAFRNMESDVIQQRKQHLQQFLDLVVAEQMIFESSGVVYFFDRSVDVSYNNGDDRSSSKKNALKVRRLAVVGFMSVGKTAVSTQFVDEQFSEQYVPTIENTHHKVVTHRGEEFVLDIVDTAGQDDSQILHQRYTIGVHGYALVFSVASRRSFEMIEVIHEKLVNALGHDRFPKVLVGNKVDLTVQREVSTEDAQRLADSWGCLLLECSAKDGDNISDVFSKLLAEIEKAAAPEEKDTCIIF
uniref:Rheb n=1 Tax=Roombia sp. NY0200 TaxID=1263497 RepID=A0A2R4IKY4_9CRYP|nr:Rheb [Roombia sp. NY0200]